MKLLLRKPSLSKPRARLRVLLCCCCVAISSMVPSEAQPNQSAPGAATADANQQTQVPASKPVTSSNVLPPPADFSPQSRDALILSHLNAAVRFFRIAIAPIQKVGEPSDMLYRDQALSQATQIADLAFQSARSEAVLLAAFAKQSGASSNAPAEGEAQKLQAVRATIAQRLVDLKAQLQTLDQQLQTVKPKQRAALEQQREETEGGIELYQAMTDSMRKIALTTDAANGSLGGDIERLQRNVPEIVAGKTKAIVPNPLESLSAARSSGVSTQAVVLFQLLSTRRSIDSWIAESDDLHDQAMQLREPLTQLVRYVISSSQTLSHETEDQNGATLNAAASRGATAPPVDPQAMRKRYDTVTATFNAVSSALVPLTQEVLTLEQSRANLLAWRSAVDSEYREVLRQLLIKVFAIAIALGVLLILGKIWQRATTRYVHDIRRRRQLLVTRRVVIGFLSGLVLIFGFVTQFNSLATFAGFITAGIAVGLQTILLSVAAYFFIVGRFGVRVGDRITVAGVTGDVIDVGLVRFYMMELAGSGTELQPTGRVAVFANSVLFQSGTPLYRQMPGAEYGWHELSVKLTASANYGEAASELNGVVKEVYESYRSRIDAQHRQVEAWMDSPIPSPEIESRLQLVEAGLQLYIRYPVVLRQGSEIDQKITQAVLQLMEGQSPAKEAISAPPIIRALTKA